MTSTLGWRRVYGITTPSVNTVVQLEYGDLRPAGVAHHSEGIYVPDLRRDQGHTTNDSLKMIDEALEDSIKRVATCKPDHIILGISAESIWGGGLEAARKIRERITRIAGDVTVTQAADALPAALKALGVSGRIAIVHPYATYGEPHLRKFFEDVGQEVVRTRPIAITSLAEIAHAKPKDMIDAVRSVDGDDIDAIVQFGANLPFGRVAAAAELWLGKPVIAVNVATYWHALRRDGIDHKVDGYGSLFSRH